MAGHSENKRTERTPWKCFRCGSEDHLIAKCPNPPKYNEKQQKQVHFNKKGNRTRNNNENNSDQKIHTSMARMSGNDECPSGNLGDSSQFTNWIMDYGATCHMKPELSDLLQVHKKIWINTLKLWTYITSQKKRTSTNKNV